METLLATNAGKTRRETVNGREYIVAPLTLIVPGVLNGSKGPLYYPPEHVARNPIAWNGMPIVVYHPDDNGVPVSARSPRVLERAGIGHIYNTTYDGKLKAEGWFDVEHTRTRDKTLAPAVQVLPRLEADRPIELSTGLFTQNTPAEAGSHHDGKPYTWIATDYQPDHLAVLPDQVGACSLKDGCGVLVNENADCVTNEEGVCTNCGGKGGKPGPCPKGTKGTASKPAASKKPAAKASTKPASAVKPKAGGDQSAKAHAASDTAHDLSQKANDRGSTPDKHIAAATAHIAASKAHTTAARQAQGTAKAIHQHATEHHKSMAEMYTKKSKNVYNTGSKGMDKPSLISWLTVNCDCWKGKEKVLETLVDEDLKKFKTQAIAAKVTNAAAAGFSGAFVTNADGEGEVAGVDIAALAEFFGITTDPAKDPVAFITELKSALDGVSKKLTGDTKEEDAIDKGADDATEGGPPAPTAPTGNRGTIVSKKTTAKEWLAGMPDEFKPVWNNAVTLEANTRAALVNRIVTANAKTEEAQAMLRPIYSKMDLQQLQTIAGALPQQHHGGVEALNPSFLGASVGLPVGNSRGNDSVDDGDDLPLPTLNYADMAYKRQTA